MLSMMNFQPNWLHMVHSGAFSYNLFCFYSNPRLIAHFAVKPHPPSPPFLFPLNVFPKSTNLTGITSRWWMLGNSKHWMCGWTSDQQVLPEANIFGLWITMFWNFFIWFLHGALCFRALSNSEFEDVRRLAAELCGRIHPKVCIIVPYLTLIYSNSRILRGE